MSGYNHGGALGRDRQSLRSTSVDACCSYEFAYIHIGRIPVHAAAILHHEALPFDCGRNLDVEYVLTDNGSEYSGTHAHSYELYLELNDIKHRRTKPNSPPTNGFVERFNQTLKREFFDMVFREKLYKELDTLQTDLNKWLNSCNTERPHQGYRNRGSTPMERIQVYQNKQ